MAVPQDSEDRGDGQFGSTDVDNNKKPSSPQPGSAEYVPDAMEGIGPTGYRRSDEDVIQDVAERLSRQSGIDSHLIKAGFQDGTVTLTGTVKDEDQKRLAEQAVLEVPGVYRVKNQLMIDHLGSSG